jgi:hypothetical protein
MRRSSSPDRAAPSPSSSRRRSIARRRGARQPFVVVNALATRAELDTAMRDAVGGTVFVDVRPLKNKAASKALVTALGGPEVKARMIVGALTTEQVRLAFDHDVTKLGEIRTPPVLARVTEIPALIDAYLAEVGSTHRVAELGAARVEALRQFEWRTTSKRSTTRPSASRCCSTATAT